MSTLLEVTLEAVAARCTSSEAEILAQMATRDRKVLSTWEAYVAAHPSEWSPVTGSVVDVDAAKRFWDGAALAAWVARALDATRSKIEVVCPIFCASLVHAGNVEAFARGRGTVSVTFEEASRDFAGTLFSLVSREPARADRHLDYFFFFPAACENPRPVGDAAQLALENRGPWIDSFVFYASHGLRWEWVEGAEIDARGRALRRADDAARFMCAHATAMLGKVLVQLIDRREALVTLEGSE